MDTAKTEAKNQLKTLVSKFANLHQQLDESFKAVQELTVEEIDLVSVHYQGSLEIKAEAKQIVDDFLKYNLYFPTAEQYKLQPTPSQFNATLYKLNAHYFKLKKQEPKDESVNPNPAKGSSYVNAHLPKITVPHFNGDIKLWPEFYATFDSLIHKNDSLEPIQKFHFLRSALTDSARAVVENFNLSNDNYQLAYKALTDRYENKRRIAGILLNKLLNYKPIHSNSLNNLKDFVDTHQNTIQAIQALNLDDIADFVLLSISLKNIDLRTRKSFEDTVEPGAFPTYDELFTFVTRQIQALELTSDNAPVHHKPKPQSFLVHAPAPATKSGNRNVATRPSSCPYCSQIHSIFACDSFNKINIDQKYQFLKSTKRCFACFRGHPTNQCNSKFACRVCNSKRHNTLLHQPSNSQLTKTSASPQAATAAPAPTTSQDPNAIPLSLACLAPKRHSRPLMALLGTFVAQIRDSFGHFVPIRGVIDPGSQVSLISDSIVRQLKLPFKQHSSPITGINATPSITTGTLSCQLRSMTQNRTIFVEAFIIPKISNQLPAASIDPALLKSIPPFSLADPSFSRPGRIDILLGADLYSTLLLPQAPLVIAQGPTAVPTLFGWTVIGPVPNSAISLPTSLLACQDLSFSLSRFWDLESVASTRTEDPLDVAAEQHFQATHSRTPEGRYMVALPFKPNAQPLQRNAASVAASFLSLERRLLKNPDALQEYQTFMQDYLALEHMSPAVNKSDYVIPHHIVSKSTIHGPKLRVVFNASSLDSNKRSLNSQLMVGPKLQQDICHVLLNFRLCRIALCCDIRQMYRQILVNPADRKHQHIFWRPAPDALVQEAELNTVTCGLAPSAFLAVRVLLQLVQDEGRNYPMASHALTHQTYVDDIICGAESISDATQLRAELSGLLKSGGFELRKWCSSHPSLLSDVPEEHRETPLSLSDEDKSLKILGLDWDFKTDSFTFRVQPFTGATTKRNMLSFIAKIFDPIGYLSPFTFALKLFIQQLWLSKVEWDQPVPPSMARNWESAIKGLNLFTQLAIPRCALLTRPYTQLHVIGFADASQLGYAAAIYICFEHEQYRQSVLWKAKTRVAPLKTVSIPKLELCAAVLLIDLLQSLLQIRYPNPIASYRMFSDSQIVLSWLSTPPHQLQTFVSNRVVHISDRSPTGLIWSHIPTDSNPADLGSRGLNPSHFLDPKIHRLWFHGPDFLQHSHIQWPPPFQLPVSNPQLPEVKDNPFSGLITASEHSFVDLLSRHSTLLRCQRVFAWCRRFIHNSRFKPDSSSRLSGPSHFLDPKIHRLWFHGPDFLQHSHIQWPPPFQLPVSNPQLPEVKDNPFSGLITASEHSFVDLLSRHSTLLRCQRVFAWCRRFIHNSRFKPDSSSRLSGPLTAGEIDQSMSDLIRITQNRYFAKEIRLISTNKPTTSLSSLSPYLDPMGLLRVGGRLSNANLPHDAKHPFLLPKQAHLSLLLCKSCHLKSLHAGPLTCQSLLRANYWILSSRSLIRRVIHSCLTCHRFRAPVIQPIMASLPHHRVTPARPFLTTGVDFAGPFRVRSSRLRKAAITKGYLCLFVCAATKAVHLEFSSDLTTDTFLACFDRFISRRGLPQTILSDQGTNFVGASKRIEEIETFLRSHSPDLNDYFSSHRIEWKFNPPHAPNFGGLWEAAVKSAKTLLYRFTANTIFTVEEYSSLFCRIEAVLNSRPLCGLSPDPAESANYLSPGHFLIGAPLLARPSLPVPTFDSLARHWKAVNQIAVLFWRRWSQEYINTLMQRSKWTTSTSPLNVGDVVYVKNSNAPPLQWPIARVIALHPGQDGISRVASLATASSTMVRPLNRLVPLPA